MNFYEFFNLLSESNFIPKNDPVRNKIYEITKKNYWKRPGEALTAIQNVLMDHGYEIEHPVFKGSDKANDQQLFSIVKILNPHDPNDDSREHVDTQLSFSWHWISDKTVEVVAYLS